MSIECLACPALGPSAPFPAYRLAGVASCPGFTGALFRRTPRHARRPRSGVSLGRLRVLPGLPQELGFRRAPLAHDGRVRLLQRIAWLASRLVRTFVRGTGCVRAASRVRATRELLLLLLSVLWCEMQCRIRGRRGAPRMLYVLRRQEHVSVRMCASGVGEVASSPYTFVVGPGARWRPRCTRVDGGCLRRPTPRRLVSAWRSEARRLLDERECAIEPHLSFCWSCCRILFCWCWAFTRGGS